MIFSGFLVLNCGAKIQLWAGDDKPGIKFQGPYVYIELASLNPGHMDKDFISE